MRDLKKKEDTRPAWGQTGLEAQGVSGVSMGQVEMTVCLFVMALICSGMLAALALFANRPRGRRPVDTTFARQPDDAAVRPMIPSSSA